MVGTEVRKDWKQAGKGLYQVCTVGYAVLQEDTWKLSFFTYLSRTPDSLIASMLSRTKRKSVAKGSILTLSRESR